DPAGGSRAARERRDRVGETDDRPRGSTAGCLSRVGLPEALGRGRGGSGEARGRQARAVREGREMSAAGNVARLPVENQAPPDTKPKSLIAKLAEVMKVIARIPKRGRNEFHGYNYATEADIVEAIRGELAERNVMLLPAINAKSRTPVGEKGSVL